MTNPHRASTAMLAFPLALRLPLKYIVTLGDRGGGRVDSQASQTSWCISIVTQPLMLGVQGLNQITLCHYFLQMSQCKNQSQSKDHFLIRRQIFKKKKRGYITWAHWTFITKLLKYCVFLSLQNIPEISLSLRNWLKSIRVGFWSSFLPSLWVEALMRRLLCSQLQSLEPISLLW